MRAVKGINHPNEAVACHACRFTVGAQDVELVPAFPDGSEMMGHEEEEEAGRI